LAGDAEARRCLAGSSAAHDVLIEGQPVAELRHTGFFGERYDIDSSFGQFTAKGSFTGWDYSISHDGQLVATVSRELAQGAQSEPVRRVRRLGRRRAVRRELSLGETALMSSAFVAAVIAYPAEPHVQLKPV
jgi:hypothetical protein